MEYNTTRNQLIMSEYGRNIQRLIEYTLSIEEREKRTKTANLIVEIMAQMNPQVRETADFRQKLWDHLHIISGFRLDVDSEFSPPSKEKLESKPEKIPYKSNSIKFKQYGKNLENIIKKAINYEEGREKEALVNIIANHIKKSYLNWNRDSVNDELILQHLESLSEGHLKLKENFKLANTGDILAHNRKKKSTGNPSRRTKENGNHKGKYKSNNPQ